MIPHYKYKVVLHLPFLTIRIHMPNDLFFILKQGPGQHGLCTLSMLLLLCIPFPACLLSPDEAFMMYHPNSCFRHLVPETC